MLCLCFHLALGARPSSHTIKVPQTAGSHNINPNSQYIYTIIGELSSKFDEFLAGRCNSTTIMAYIFLRLHVANPRSLCDRFLRFFALCFLR